MAQQGESSTRTDTTENKHDGAVVQEQEVVLLDEQRTLWQNAKKYRKVVYIMLGLSSAILLYGYDYVIVGTVAGMPSFQKDFGILHTTNEYILPSTWLALWNASSPIGGMLGSLFAGWLQDRTGRRTALGTSSFLSGIGVAIMFTSYLPTSLTGRRTAFLFGKLVQGSGIGAVMAVCQTYMSEIVPAVLRGSGMAFFPVFTLLGQLFGAVVIYAAMGHEKGYAVAFATQWPFSAVPILVTLWIPESPTWCARKGKVEDAWKAQARLCPPGGDAKAGVEEIFRDLQREERACTTSYRDCFRGGNLRRTGLVVWAQALPAMFGLQLLAKGSYFLQLVEMEASTSIVFLILGIVIGLFANVASIWVVARVGRRYLVVGSLVIAAALWASMGIANCSKIVAGVTWWTAISMMLVILVCGLGVWPASYAIAAETSSLQLRARTQGIGWFVSALTTTVAGVALPYVFNPDEGNLRGKTGFTYAVSCALGAVVSWYIVPEMKGRSVREIDAMFNEGIAARKFKSWRETGTEVPRSQASERAFA